MNAQPSPRFPFFSISTLLRGDVGPIAAWTREWNPARMALCALVIIVGAGAYGASMGAWRDATQMAYSAIKLPLVILLTTLGNALINGMLAPLLGLNLRFRESLASILISFAIASAILGAMSPLILFMVWNTPPPGSATSVASFSYSLLLLTEVLVIAFAGITANLRLLHLLRNLGGSSSVAWRVLFNWLAVNLLLGAQLSWMLRPFLGLRSSPTTFFSPEPFHGNFFEAVFHALRAIFSF